MKFFYINKKRTQKFKDRFNRVSQEDQSSYDTYYAKLSFKYE